MTHPNRSNIIYKFLSATRSILAYLFFDLPGTVASVMLTRQKNSLMSVPQLSWWQTVSRFSLLDIELVKSVEDDEFVPILRTAKERLDGRMT